MIHAFPLISLGIGKISKKVQRPAVNFGGNVTHASQGSFFNYLDETREVGGNGNVNGKQGFSYDSKGITPPHWLGSQVVNNGHNVVNVAKE